MSGTLEEVDAWGGLLNWFYLAESLYVCSICVTLKECNYFVLYTHKQTCDHMFHCNTQEFSLYPRLVKMR